MESVALDDAVRWVRRQVEQGPLPSAVLGVATSGGIQFLEAFSGSDERPARVDDHYALYSVTKPLTGIAMARAIERGDLSLRRDLSTVLPDAPGGPAHPWRSAVRLEHLLSHTAGLVEPALDDPRPLDEQLATAGQAFVAGTRISYSNIAFHGAAKLFTAATGRAVHDDIEALAGLTGAADGSLTFDAASDPHRVYGQERAGVSPDRIAAARHPAAGVNGTAEGLLSLGASLLRALGGARGEVLHPETARGMTISRTAGLPEAVPNDDRRDFGLTWHLRDESSGLLHRDAIGHEGWTTTQWWIYPELDLCFTLLTNVLDARGLGVDPDELNNAVVAGS
ncbi:serine hydrolase domain-containing protein [Herbiconiux daphne]|uniref:Beta-lactamase family protein n=1 Tax=Herbiconiux daphne TaxID=2970914 RepID=A0ABT2H7T3_9MICO|nr:serine hydrolase domain-containing protein [Herbiconiux daphne]MCS5735993.1 beta-lactamase family protein [Herbiconiux daphne]